MAGRRGMAAEYEHRQRATAIWLLLLPAPLIVAAVAGPGHPAFWLTMAIELAIGVVFGSMTVRVGEGRLDWWFGPGLWRYSRPLGQVLSATPVENRWWWGWGIRATPHGWLYNVSGLGAVEIATRDGRTLRIGTDEPERLAAAV